MGTASNIAYLKEIRYDDNVVDYNSMYDQMPFVWDTDMNVERIITKVSGNLIKFYRCKINEPYELKHI